MLLRSDSITATIVVLCFFGALFGAQGYLQQGRIFPEGLIVGSSDECTFEGMVRYRNGVLELCRVGPDEELEWSSAFLSAFSGSNCCESNQGLILQILALHNERFNKIEKLLTEELSSSSLQNKLQCSGNGVYNPLTSTCTCIQELPHGFYAGDICYECAEGWDKDEEGRCVVDVEPPTIQLVGDNVVTHDLGVAYIDDGVTTNDNYLPEEVRVESDDNVDINTIGSYMYNYTAYDSFNNSAFTSREVRVSYCAVENPCLNGGQCVDNYEFNNFSCACVGGFSGPVCNDSAHGTTPETAAVSCKGIRNAHIASGLPLVSQTYWLIRSSGPAQVYCDMETDGGGWTLMARYDLQFSGRPIHLPVNTGRQDISIADLQLTNSPGSSYGASLDVRTLISDDSATELMHVGMSGSSSSYQEYYFSEIYQTVLDDSSRLWNVAYDTNGGEGVAGTCTFGSSASRKDRWYFSDRTLLSGTPDVTGTDVSNTDYYLVGGEGTGMFTNGNREGAMYSSSAYTDCTGHNTPYVQWGFQGKDGSTQGYGCPGLRVGTPCGSASSNEPANRYNLMFIR